MKTKRELLSYIKRQQATIDQQREVIDNLTKVMNQQDAEIYRLKRERVNRRHRVSAKRR